MIHPNQKFTVDIDRDRDDLPDDQHRRFDFSYGSSAEYIALEDILASEKLAKLSLKQVLGLLTERLHSPDDAARVAETTTPEEQVTLLVCLGELQTLAELQAKKSRQPSPSNAESSVQDAARETATAAAN